MLQRAIAAFVAPHAHSEGGAEENEQDRHPLKQWSDISNIAGEERFDPEENEKAYCGKKREK